MATSTLTPASAQLAILQADNNNKMALLRRDNAELKRLNETKDDQISRMSASLSVQTTKGRFWMGLSTATTAGSAMVGGALDGFLTAKNAHKIGPVNFTSLAGLGAAIGGIASEDVMIGELLSAVGRGLVAGPLWEAGRRWGEGKAVASPQGNPGNPSPLTTTPAKR